MDTIRRLFRLILQTIGLLTVTGAVVLVVGAVAAPRLLQIEDKIETADYILPLAGNWHRYIKAAELYKDGAAPAILLSNSQIRPPKRIDRIRAEMGDRIETHRAFRDRLFAHLGVPKTALKPFGDGHISTVEEAEALRAFLKNKPARIILVTTAYHSRRAKLTFEQTMPGSRFMVTSPPEGRLKRRWWADQRSAQTVVLESFKLLYYLVGGGFRAQTGEP